jgi:hypothetical protein
VRRLGVWVAGLSLAASMAGAEEVGRDLLERADSFLTLPRSFVAEQEVTFFKERKKEREMRVRVWVRYEPVRGDHDLLSVVFEPSEDRGKALLRDGEAIWFSGPGSNRSTRVSGEHSVAGRLTIADLLRTGYPRDYLVRSVDRETIRLASDSVLEAERLDLVARPEATTYPRVELFLDPADHRPVMARAYDRRDKLLKTILFRDYAPVLGGVHPRQLVVVQSGGRGHVHEIRLTEIREETLAGELFEPEALAETARRLLAESW